ncbi:MAG: DUF2079 domain-containing protein [Candidatus Omnitrophota bacterium]
MKSIEKSSLVSWLINSTLLLAGLAAIFFLLTSGVLFVQAGWIHELGKKGRYVRLMGISVSVFAVLMFLARWKFRNIFDGCCWVKWWQGVCRIPFRYTAMDLFVIYAAMMAGVGFERQLALETRAFDLGLFAQAVWNTLQGDFLFCSIKENINLLGDHVSPILLATVPFYAIWPDPCMLVLLQALAAASSFFPLALIVRDKLKDRSLVLIFLLMFFFFQPMRAALHEDFHPEVLAEPFLWWAFFFLDRGKVVRFLLCLAVAVTGKENFFGIAFMLGFYACVWKKMRWTGILVMTTSVVLLLWETRWLVPHLSGAVYFYGGNYSRMLADPVHGIFLRLLSFESLEYLFKIFVPFLFLPFFHLPTLLLTFPVLFQNLLSGNGAMRSFNYHYVTGMTPFLFISTIYALARLRDRKVWIAKHLSWIGFALLFASVLRSGPSEYWFFWNIHSHRSAHTDMVRAKLREIPPSARILTHNTFVPQLCNRKYIYQFNYNPKPDKIDFVEKYKTDTVIWDRNYWEPNTESLETSLERLQSAGFSVEFEKDGFYILRKTVALAPMSKYDAATFTD